jgi:hypothetical protein
MPTSVISHVTKRNVNGGGEIEGLGSWLCREVKVQWKPASMETDRQTTVAERHAIRDHG